LLILNKAINKNFIYIINKRVDHLKLANGHYKRKECFKTIKLHLMH